MQLVEQCFQEAGLGKAFEVLDHDEFLAAVEDAGVYDALANGSMHRLLQSLMSPGLLPATHQKLADAGWSDDDVAKLFDGGVLKEEQTALIFAINAGALSLAEYDEHARAPNQEIDIIFYTEGAGSVLSWLQERMTVPKIEHAAFGG